MMIMIINVRTYCVSCCCFQIDESKKEKEENHHHHQTNETFLFSCVSVFFVSVCQDTYSVFGGKQKHRQLNI